MKKRDQAHGSLRGLCANELALCDNLTNHHSQAVWSAIQATRARPNDSLPWRTLLRCAFPKSSADLVDLEMCAAALVNARCLFPQLLKDFHAHVSNLIKEEHPLPAAQSQPAFAALLPDDYQCQALDPFDAFRNAARRVIQQDSQASDCEFDLSDDDDIRVQVREDRKDSARKQIHAVEMVLACAQETLPWRRRPCSRR